MASGTVSLCPRRFDPQQVVPLDWSPCCDGPSTPAHTGHTGGWNGLSSGGDHVGGPSPCPLPVTPQQCSLLSDAQEQGPAQQRARGLFPDYQGHQAFPRQSTLPCPSFTTPTPTLPKGYEEPTTPQGSSPLSPAPAGASRPRLSPSPEGQARGSPSGAGSSKAGPVLSSAVTPAASPTPLSPAASPTTRRQMSEEEESRARPVQGSPKSPRKLQAQSLAAGSSHATEAQSPVPSQCMGAFRRSATCSRASVFNTDPVVGQEYTEMKPPYHLGLSPLRQGEFATNHTTRVQNDALFSRGVAGSPLEDLTSARIPSPLTPGVLLGSGRSPSPCGPQQSQGAVEALWPGGSEERCFGGTRDMGDTPECTPGESICLFRRSATCSEPLSSTDLRLALQLAHPQEGKAQGALTPPTALQRPQSRDMWKRAMTEVPVVRQVNAHESQELEAEDCGPGASLCMFRRFSACSEFQENEGIAKALQGLHLTGLECCDGDSDVLEASLPHAGYAPEPLAWARPAQLGHASLQGSPWVPRAVTGQSPEEAAPRRNPRRSFSPSSRVPRSKGPRAALRFSKHLMHRAPSSDTAIPLCKHASPPQHQSPGEAPAFSGFPSGDPWGLPESKPRLAWGARIATHKGRTREQAEGKSNGGGSPGLTSIGGCTREKGVGGSDYAADDKAVGDRFSSACSGGGWEEAEQVQQMVSRMGRKREQEGSKGQGLQEGDAASAGDANGAASEESCSFVFDIKKVGERVRGACEGLKHHEGGEPIQGTGGNPQCNSPLSGPVPCVDRKMLCVLSSSAQSCNLIPLGDLLDATRSWDASAVIGKGSYGTVYKATLHGMRVAIKRLDSESWQGSKEYHTEVYVLGTLQHPNLVRLLGHCPEAKCLVYEYIPHGSLQDWLGDAQRRQRLTWQRRVRILAGMASAVSALHFCSPAVVHRDIKPANVLLDPGFNARLADVGVARLIMGLKQEDTTYTVSGTAGYIDPEGMRTFEVSPASDVYAMGVTMLQVLLGEETASRVHSRLEAGMVLGKRGSREHALLLHVMQSLDPLAGVWPESVAQKVVEVVLRCLSRERVRRPCIHTEVVPCLMEAKQEAMLL